MEKYYRIKEAAEQLSIGKSTLWKYINQGKINSIKLSPGITVIAAAELERYVNEAAQLFS